MTSARPQAKSAPEPQDTDPNLWSEYEIEAHTSLVDRPLRTLKHGDAFAVLDNCGDIGTIADTAEGLFYRDTRYLSHYALRIEGRRPLLLNSNLQEDRAALAVHMTNPDLMLGKDERLSRDTIFVQRTELLWQATSYERIRIKNYDRVPRRLRIDILFDADFADLFEVRGTKRRQHGQHFEPQYGRDRANFRYRGLDGIERRTVLTFSPPPAVLAANRATFDITLAPDQQVSLFATISCSEAEPAPAGNFFYAYRETGRARRASLADIASVTTANDLFNEVLSRARSDIYTLVTHTEFGAYPYAGIPWFSTVFGRDGIITAMLMAWVDPTIARGVLRFLAATQATGFDAKADAQPGKILHEMRRGEMANLGEVPFRQYYGSIDSTPLFLMLAGQYFERTGDDATIAEIWPNIEAALRWIDESGDADGDGFVEYRRAAESGLANQGWKDSHDAIFHADGSGAEGSIALCEVQGYVFAAKRSVAALARRRGDHGLAKRLEDEAETLRQRFEAAFWCPEIGTYALALDGRKQPCRVRSSNAGHALFTGIASAERAERVAETLMARESFSGWGIRTVAQGEARYNPMAYHNGSVWPHDNALIAAGFARYGLKNEVARLLEGLFSAAIHQEGRRLPELFCGIIRRSYGGPTAYPVACSPQAWASATPFGLIAASLGLELRHGAGEIVLRDPVMPEALSEIVIGNLGLADARLDIQLRRHDTDVTANLLKRCGSIRVVTLR